MRLAIALLLCASTAHAVTTKTWRVTSYHEFDEGETTGVLLSSEGEALSGFTANRVDVPESQVFSSATAPDGSVWLGTGDGANLYRYTPKDGVKKVARLGESANVVSSLVAAPDGTIYAGVLPGGRVWKVVGGKASELCKLDGAEHVWALALAGRSLLAATGPNGRVYSIEPATGKNRVVWDSGERQVLSLAVDGKGGFWAGTADDAILYHVDATGAARALHDFDGDELRAIAVRGDTLYVTVNEFEKTGVAASAATKARGTKIVLPSGATASATDPARARKGKGAVYRVDGDGRVEQLHALADAYFTALHVDRDGTVWAAGGSNGRLYQIRADRTVLTALDLPERQILTLALDGPHPLVGTGDAGSIYALDWTPPKDAAYVSKVFDAGWPSHWGALRWSSTGNVALETRTGNTARPDKTWSAWQVPTRNGKGVGEDGNAEGKVVSPAARYVQFRAGFGKGAVLRDVSLWYAPQNQRARVVEITVGDDPGQKLARAARAAGKPRSPVVKVKWKVENPDDDDLDYRLYYREENETNWKPLGGPDPLTAKEWEWNTEAIPDGNYVLKVVVSDEKANPKDQALEHELVSTPFLVDNRKPEVQGLNIAAGFLSGVARDSFSPITEMGYSIDGGDWQTLGPRDGIFDDPTEEFALKLPADLAAGAHSIAVRAVDAADNVGLSQTTFRIGK